MKIIDAVDLNCQLCELHKTRKQVVVGKGNENANIILIGEAPGASENESGIPFCGRAGKLLDELLKTVELNIDDIYVTNVVSCRPPNNRDPYPYEIKACRKYLARKIKIIKPKLFIILGRIAVSLFSPSGSAERGKIFDWLDYKVLYVYHPAALLYNPKLRPIMEKHLLQNKEFIDSIK